MHFFTMFHELLSSVITLLDELIDQDQQKPTDCVCLKGKYN